MVFIRTMFTNLIYIDIDIYVNSTCLALNIYIYVNNNPPIAPRIHSQTASQACHLSSTATFIRPYIPHIQRAMRPRKQSDSPTETFSSARRSLYEI